MKKLTNRELELLTQYLGYIYKEEGIMTDAKEMKCETVYSKTPIDIDVFPYDGPVDDEVVIAAGGIQNLTQKYFKDLPNPDFGRDPDESLHDDFIPIKWDVTLPTLSWCSLNEYKNEEYFQNFATDVAQQLWFFELIKSDWQLVLNSEKVGLYARKGSTYFATADGKWFKALWSIISKYLQAWDIKKKIAESEGIVAQIDNNDDE